MMAPDINPCDIDIRDCYVENFECSRSGRSEGYMYTLTFRKAVPDGKPLFTIRTYEEAEKKGGAEYTPSHDATDIAISGAY